MRTQIYLRRGKEESLLRRHPWIFSGAIERVKSQGEVKEGEFTGRMWALDNRKLFNHGRKESKPKANLE